MDKGKLLILVVICISISACSLRNASSYDAEDDIFELLALPVMPIIYYNMGSYGEKYTGGSAAPLIAMLPGVSIGTYTAQLDPNSPSYYKNEYTNTNTSPDSDNYTETDLRNESETITLPNSGKTCLHCGKNIRDEKSTWFSYCYECKTSKE